MPANQRSERVADQIQIEMADILSRRLKDPRHGFLTVTAVEVTRDLRHAKVFISALTETELAEGLATLERAKGFVRSELSRRIRLRIAPELDFRADRSIEHALKVAALLRQAETGELPPEPDEDDGKA